MAEGNDSPTVAAKRLEDMAEAIERVAAIGEALQASRLKRRAVVLLIKDLCGAPTTIGDIERILNALPRLRVYVKPKPRATGTR